MHVTLYYKLIGFLIYCLPRKQKAFAWYYEKAERFTGAAGPYHRTDLIKGISILFPQIHTSTLFLLSLPLWAHPAYTSPQVALVLFLASSP